jgi:hypothetical protein
MLGATVLTAYAQLEANALASFKKETSAYMAHYKKYMMTTMVSGEGDKWLKISLEASDFSIDVRKTDSLVSPYIGTLDFTVTIRFTANHETRAEAEADSSFVGDSGKGIIEPHKHIYAFQDGKWVSKSRQQYNTVHKEWEDCGLND